MKKILAGLALMCAGAGLHALYAQTSAPTFEGTFRHMGFVVHDVVKAALGEHLTERFLEAKRNEVLQYNLHVSRWEIDNYLGRY